MVPILPPDLITPDRADFPHAPSWSGVPGDGFLNDEHRGIYRATKDLPGWQDAADSEKLYEMAYRSGSVILEIGVYGGRSAVVELRGARSAARERGLPEPQYFGVDIDPGFVQRSHETAARAGVADSCLFFHGDLARFLREIPIVPTMVFVDGDHAYPGCWADLQRLSRWLAPGTPVMCHDYGGIEGVRRAVDEWIATGRFILMGRFAGSILLRVRGEAAGFGVGLSPPAFADTRDALLARYFSPTAPSLRFDRHYTMVRDLTRMARVELTGESGGRVASGRGAWPYAAERAAVLPPTMPGGVPWPRISVVTPSFNQGKYIEETILSVRNQGYPNVEHLIMDGGSTDQTMRIIARYRDGLARVVSEKDGGQSDAINKGFGLATGQILTWLNSDDQLAPGALAAAALAFQRTGADLVAGECHIHQNGRVIQRHLTSCDDGPLPLKHLLEVEARWLEGQFFYQPEVMFTREIWEKAGGHVRTDLYHSMDYDLWCRMAHAGAKLHVIGRPMALFRAHAEQKTAGNVVGGFRTELPMARDEFLRRAGVDWKGPGAEPSPTARPALRVVMFNDLGYAYGAGIAHRRLARALLEAGHEVFAVAAAAGELHGAAPKTTAEDTLAAIASFKPDLVVVGNLHGADVDPAILGLIAARFPTAFVVHDLWLLTGRCAYTGGCRKYLEGCDETCTCDRSHPKMAPELVRPAWETKRTVLGASGDLHLWANSRWALAQVREALGQPAPGAGRSIPHAIAFGLELDVFRPRDRAACREALGLPQDRFIVMSSSSSLADPRKGLKHLADAMAMLRLEDSLVVCVGWFGAGEQPPIPGMRAMGYLSDPQKLAMLYSAADVFVGPSLEEAFGQVFIEAAACGTPSVGYPVGGKPEAILDGVSGLLTEEATPAALADAIESLYLDRAWRESMGAWARIWAESCWSMTASARRLAVVMRKQGLAGRLNLRPRLNLQLNPKAPPEPVVVGATAPGWRAVSGFDPWEGPYPEQALARCRWAVGPRSRFDVDAARAGPSRVLISCRTYDPGQRVRLIHAGRVIGEADVPPDNGRKTDHVLQFKTNVRAGANAFEMQFWNWQPGARPLALLVSAIAVIPESEWRPPAAAVNGAASHRPIVIVEPKKAAASTR
jgi:glycosyltransferase involved in cell wall biosynthesis